MFRADNDGARTTADRVVVRDGAHGRHQAVEYAFRIVGDMIRDTVWSLGRNAEDGVVVWAEALFDVIRRPRARLLVFGDAEAVFTRMAQGALVEVARPRATDIEEDQAYGTADRRIGAVAWAEDVSAGIHADLGTDRTVHHDQRGRRLRPQPPQYPRGRP